MSRSDQLDKIRELLKNGRIQDLSKFGGPGAVIRTVCEHGDLDIFKQLIAYSDRVEYRINGRSDGRSPPLAIACKEGHLHIVKILLGMDGIDADLEGQSLFEACSGGNLMIVKLLLDAGSDPKKEYCGWTPLGIACHKENSDIARLLLSYPKTIEINHETIKTQRGQDRAIKFAQSIRKQMTSSVIIEKHDRDLSNGLVACKGVLALLAPSLVKYVMGSNFIDALESSEKKTLQLVIDSLIYNTSIVISDIGDIIVALYLIGCFKGESMSLKSRLMKNFKCGVVVSNALDQIERIEHYLNKPRPLDVENTCLSALRDYCISFIAIEAKHNNADYERYVGNDTRIDKYYPAMIKISHIKNLVLSEPPIQERSLAEAFNDRSYSDITLNIAGKEVYCHRSILALKSHFLATLSTSNHNMDKRLTEEYLYIVRHCYGILGDSIPNHLIENVIDAADMDNIEPLITIASKQLEITRDNFDKYAGRLIGYIRGQSLKRSLMVIKGKMLKFLIHDADFTKNNLDVIPECVKDDAMLHFIK